MSEEKFVMKVFRFDPHEDKKPRYETYEGPLVSKMTVMDALRYIYENCANIAFRFSCTGDVNCGICRMQINGKLGLACHNPATIFMTVEPANKEKVIRDLISEI